MGVRLTGPDEGPIPRPVWLHVTCDGNHGLLEAPQARFSESGLDGYVIQRSAAVRAGWRFAGDGKTFGPCCRNVKAPKEGD